jgi:hypothetical protein
MREGTRDWLRGFLKLAARADSMTVPRRDVERQEDTVLRALTMLEEQPGVVLADEVGMGKTFEALGVIAARHHADPTRRTLVLTPGPDLNGKWGDEFRAFCDPQLPMYEGFLGQYSEARTLRGLMSQTAVKPIVIAPVSMFGGGRAMRDNAYLLSLFFHWRQEHGNTAVAAFRRYRNGALCRVDPAEELFLDEIPWERVEPVLDVVMRSTRDKPLALDRAFTEAGHALFDGHEVVDRALAELRFRLIRALLPKLDLLVVDEAHKLKNAGTLRALAVREAFEGRFEKALFLTATPFQLDVGELRQVLDLFSLARSAPGDLRRQADSLLADVAAYKAAYEAFEGVWRRMDGATAKDFERLYTEDPGFMSLVEDPSLAAVVDRARKLLELKRTRIEPGFRRWMIRSLREEKRTYRHHSRVRLKPANGDAVPFLLYERFIAELFRSKERTHKAAVQINMVSSYGAARQGAILADEVKGLGGDTERYRLLLRRVLDDVKVERSGHPKMSFVVVDALKAAEHGEKSLIFCSRIQTLRELKRQLADAWTERLIERWREVDPEATFDTVFDTKEEADAKSRGRHSRLRDRIHRTQDQLYLALRENYLKTVLDTGELARDNLDEVTRVANATLRGLLISPTRAERLDWLLVKRCVEHAAARLFRERGDDEGHDRAALDVVCDPKFVMLGYDHIADSLEADIRGPATPRWSIDRAHAATIVDPRPNLWSHMKSMMFGIPPGRRVLTVERLARYLTHQEVPFLVDVLSAAKRVGLDVDSVESAALQQFIDSFWTSAEGRPWTTLIRSFLHHLQKLDDGRRRELLDGAIAAGEFARHTADGESRERLREAFNTPLFPMVLVANEVMQEGLDLHQQCARVVHHDLAWNPAQLEQRVGRVDRLGSLVHRRRDRDKSARLEVVHPLIERTIDIRLDRTVRAREKWLEFLLGAPPDFGEFNLADEPVVELPEAFAEALKVSLEPPRADAPGIPG